MVKVKLVDIVNAKETLQKLMNEKLPVFLSYKLAKVMKEISTELDSVEASRTNLVKKHGEKIEDKPGDSWQVSKENLEAFHKEFEELLQMEAELNFDPIPILSFGTDSKICMSSGEMMKISFLFD